MYTCPMANCCPQKKIKSAVEVFTYRADLECGHQVELMLARGQVPPDSTCCPKCRVDDVLKAVVEKAHQAFGVPEGLKPD